MPISLFLPGCFLFRNGFLCRAFCFSVCYDPGQIFAVFERGVLTYDVVADTPAGESIP